MSSPAYPICGAAPEPFAPYLVESSSTIGGYGVGCALRVLAYPATTLRFEHYRGDLLLDVQDVAGAGTPHEVRELRHECDGSTSYGYRVAALEYGYLPPNAAVGDTVKVYGESGELGTVTIVEFGCPTLDWADTECQVCAPDESMGCSTGAGDASGLGIALALAVMLAVRRACAC